MSELEEQQEQEMTDEQYTELEQKYRSGEVTEESTEEVKDETETTEEPSEATQEEEPKNDGAAIKENKRLRELNRELTESQNQLKQQFEDLSRKVQSLDKPVEEKKDPIKDASNEQLLETEAAIEESLYEAYQQGDKEQVKKLSGIKQRIRAELLERPGKKVEASNEEKQAAAEWGEFEQEVIGALPEVKDQNSELWKTAKEFLAKRPTMAKKLGPAAGVMSLAAAVLLQGKGEKKTGKTETKPKDILNELETVAKSATKRSPSTTSPKQGSGVHIPDPEKDADGFEEMWQKVRSGQVKLDGW